MLEKLEILAFEKRNCTIVFLEDDERVTIHGIVNGIYERGEGHQVLKMQSGEEILLEKLIIVDGTSAESLC